MDSMLESTSYQVTFNNSWTDIMDKRDNIKRKSEPTFAGTTFVGNEFIQLAGISNLPDEPQYFS